MKKAILNYRILFIFLFCLFFIPAHFLNDKQKSGDDLSYLSHAMTLGIDFDLDYENEIAITYNKYHNIPAHFIGTGALVAPFVGFFAIIDKMNNHNVIENRQEYFTSWSYFGFLFGINFYFLISILMLYEVLKKLFNLKISILLFSVTSSGILYYTLGRYTMSHSMEFFSSTLIIYLVFKLFYIAQNNEKTFLLSFFVGFSTVMMLWIRPSNYTVILLPFIVYFILVIMNNQKINQKITFSIGLSIVLWLLPYFIFNNYFFHSIIPSTEEVYGGDLMQEMGIPNGILNKLLYLASLTPNLLLVLFSSEVGVLYSSPIIVLGLVGALYFFIQKFHDNKFLFLLIFALSFIYFSFPFAIVLVWKTTASDYGYRYLFSLIPLSIFFFGYLYLKLSENFFLKLMVYLLFTIGILNLFFFKTTLELFPQPQINVYGKYHNASLKNYEYHLMSEIVTPKTWILAMGKTYFGFLVAEPALKTELIKLVPKPIKDKYIHRFYNIPWVIYIQTFVLLILWGVFGYIIDRRKKDEINHTNSLLQ